MKYRIDIIWETQRNRFKTAVKVEADDANDAQVKACGLLLINEHIKKDRYIKIVDMVVVENEPDGPITMNELKKKIEEEKKNGGIQYK